MKVSQQTDRKLTNWMTRLGKLTFPLKWKQMERNNYERELWDLSFEDQIVVDIINELCEKGLVDILIIMG